MAGVGGLATWPVLGGCEGGLYTRGERGPATRSTPFNTGWRFGEAIPDSASPSFDDSGLEQVTLPHMVTNLSWQQWDPESWEKVWLYRRRFSLDEDLAGMRIFLDFGAAMTAATLTLNGKKIGEHLGGYLPFSFELTDHLVEGENVLAVELDSRFNINVPPNRPNQKTTAVDFWQPGGLYHPVSLRVVPRVFLADVFAKPVGVLDQDRRLEVECTVDAAVRRPPEGPLRVDVVLRDGDDQIGAASVPVSIQQTGQKTVKLTLEELEDIRLWEIEDPRLYDVVVTLSAGGDPVHDYAVRTGFREARFTKEGFYLNGRRVQIFGVNRHQFYPFAGGAMPSRVQRKDAEILKEDLNCNMVRCSHYPQAEAFFDACDELGLMAFEEAAGWGMWMGDAQWQDRALHDVGQMVRSHRNHPSIIIWGARLNETPDNVDLYTKTRDLAYKLDDSRQTTGSMIGGRYNTDDFVQDVFSYNDYSSQQSEQGVRWPELRPPRKDFPYLVSEAVGTLSGPAKYYRRTVPAIKQQGQAEAHAIVHNIAGSNERYCGLLAWSGYDYPSGTGNNYDGVKYTGVIDLFRVPKLGAAIYQAQIDPTIRPVIAPAFYWDFGPKSLPFKDGREAMICSNCERLKLFVDDQHYATVHPAAERFEHLPYPPSFVSFQDVDASVNPELRIEGYVGEEQVISRSFSADPAGDRLAMVADDKELIADGSDATRVVFRAVDKNGAPRPYVGGEITFTLEGSARLVGDNPFAFEDTGGVGAVWIRTQPGKTGRIRLRADHVMLGSATADITSIKS